MPLEGFQSQVWLMLQGGTPVAEIAQRLGTDVGTVERALAEAEAQVRRDMADFRLEDLAGPIEFHTRPNPLVTRDGVEIRWQTAEAGNAVIMWERLRREFGTSGLWPVIVAGAANFGFDGIARTMDDATARNARPAADLLDRADSIDAGDLFRTMWSDSQEIDDEDEDADLEEDDLEDDDALETYDEGRPPGAVDPVPSPLVGDATGELAILLVPAARPEDVLAVVGWGDWNACPPPEEHVVVLRSWRERYGAELQAMSFDTLELVVAHPPPDFAATLPLAREQFAYANDIVFQGVHPSIGELAAALAGSTRWHFWWD